MHTLQQTFSDRPLWQQQVRPRLAVSLCIALLLLVAVLLLVKFAPLPLSHDTKIELRLLTDTKLPLVESLEPEELLESEAIAEPDEPVQPIDHVAAAEPAEVPEPAETSVRDWYADAENAVLETVAAAGRIDSMHSMFDEQRRMATINFPASQASVKKPIWENVETDQMGRKILVSGNCYRVLEDPRATYYEIQRTFGQYIIYCSREKENPMDVAWVKDIPEGYAYLNYRDGEIPTHELSVLTRQYQPHSQE